MHLAPFNSTWTVHCVYSTSCLKIHEKHTTIWELVVCPLRSSCWVTKWAKPSLNHQYWTLPSHWKPNKKIWQANRDFRLNHHPNSTHLHWTRRENHLPPTHQSLSNRLFSRLQRLKRRKHLKWLLLISLLAFPDHTNMNICLEQLVDLWTWCYLLANCYLHSCYFEDFYPHWWSPGLAPMREKCSLTRLLALHYLLCSCI